MNPPCRVLGRLAPMTSSSTRAFRIGGQQTTAEGLGIRQGLAARLTAAGKSLVQRSPFAVAAAAAVAKSAAAAEAAAQVSASTAFHTIASPMDVSLANGTYTFALFATDLAGNTGSTGEYQISVGSGVFAPQPPPPPSPPPGADAPALEPSAAARRSGMAASWLLCGGALLLAIMWAA